MEGGGAGTRMQETEAGRNRKRRMRAMVAVDESDGSLYALQWALDYLVDGGTGGGVGLAQTNEPGEEESGMITLVHVQQPFHQNIYSAGPGGAGHGCFTLL